MSEQAPVTMKAPFPAFGGKSRVAAEVWRRFGDVRNYVEPFCFSAAVLLRRPGGAGAIAVNENAARERVWFSPHCLGGQGEEKGINVLDAPSAERRKRTP